MEGFATFAATTANLPFDARNGCFLRSSSRFWRGGRCLILAGGIGEDESSEEKMVQLHGEVNLWTPGLQEFAITSGKKDNREAASLSVFNLSSSADLFDTFG